MEYVRKSFCGYRTSRIFALSGQAIRADGCQKRVEQADHRLHEAIEHRGYQSEEAEHARHELREARERCWDENHRWWNPTKNAGIQNWTETTTITGTTTITMMATVGSDL